MKLFCFGIPAITVFSLTCLLSSFADGEEFDVYILTGQSNSLGTTASNETMASPGVDPADATTGFFWDNANASNTVYPVNSYGDSGGALTTLQTQQGDGGGNPTFWGPEFGFARGLSGAGKSNVVVIKASRGGGGNVLWDKATFDANNNNGHMWGHLRDTVDAGLAEIVNNGDTFNVRGMMYLQGESNNATDAAAAGTRLDSLITNLTSHIETDYSGSTTGFKTVIGEIAASQSNANRSLTTTNQMTLATASSDIAFVGTSDLALKADNIHFGGAEKLNIGQRFANAMLARQINETTLAQIAAATDATAILFDLYVPDANGATNGVNLNAPNTFTGFVDGINGQASVGLKVDGSGGSVVFADYFAADTTSDIAAGGFATADDSGESVTFTFVDPLSGQDALVAGVGFELNATSGDGVVATFLDIDGNVLLETGVLSDGTIGYESVNSFTGESQSLIHQVIFQSDTGNLWTLGHRNDTVTPDFVFHGLTTAVPEPGSAAVLACLFVCGILRRRRG